jgi:hypothetical protein
MKSKGDAMEKFELTEEQRQQGQKALEAGERRAFITCTPEQRDYMRRIKAMEDEAFEREQIRLRIRKLEERMEQMQADLAELKGAK